MRVLFRFSSFLALAILIGCEGSMDGSKGLFEAKGQGNAISYSSIDFSGDGIVDALRTTTFDFSSGSTFGERVYLTEKTNTDSNLVRLPIVSEQGQNLGLEVFFPALAFGDAILPVKNGNVFTFELGDGTEIFSSTLEQFPEGASLDINAGHAGAWFNPVTPGQGFLIDIEPQSQFIFIAWFTFDATGGKGGQLPGAGNRWFTAQGNYDGSTATIDLFATTGGALNAADDVETDTIGSVQFTVSSCIDATLAYEFSSLGFSAEIPITKLLGDVFCERIANGEIEGVR